MDSFDFILAALQFNEKINERDLDGLTGLMTEDHVFVDSDNAVTKGKDVMRNMWGEFFKRFPDYRNVFTSVTVQNDIVVIVGYSTCSFKQLDGPNVWTARIRDGRVQEWRVILLDRR